MSVAKLSGAGIQIAQQASGNSLALTSTPVALSLFSTIGADCPGNASLQSDFSVKPDKANNRLVLLAPGIYRCSFWASWVQSVAAVVTARFRKKLVAVTTAPILLITTTTGTNHAHFVAEIAVTEADILDGLGIAAFADPAAGGVVGAGFAPKNGVALDIDLAAASNGNFVVSNCRLYAEKIG